MLGFVGLVMSHCQAHGWTLQATQVALWKSWLFSWRLDVVRWEDNARLNLTIVPDGLRRRGIRFSCFGRTEDYPNSIQKGNHQAANKKEHHFKEHCFKNHNHVWVGDHVAIEKKHYRPLRPNEAHNERQEIVVPESGY
jgi:hypothetical protein